MKKSFCDRCGMELEPDRRDNMLSGVFILPKETCVTTNGLALVLKYPPSVEVIAEKDFCTSCLAELILKRRQDDTTED